MNEFYVGYAPKAPVGLGRAIMRIILALNLAAIGIVLLLVFGQSPFADSRFEYLQYREHRGVIVDSPYPNLRTRNGIFLLVAPGKHGATDLIRGYNQREVQLSGSLIRRDEGTMLEAVPGSIQALSEPVQVKQSTDIGAVELTGEIVDSKCFLGVMNPGSGKVHGDCAVRCISCGIPPALVVKDSAGAIRSIVLSGIQSRDILEFVAEPVRIRGRLQRMEEMLILLVERSGNKLAIERD